MRVIMMGTGPFAVPTFRALLDSSHEVPALFTRPARPIHGKSRAEANPMGELALERGLRTHEPESVNTPHARCVLASYQPDLLVVCDYGQILKPETLEIARLGGINLHASLLPKYRGAAPINWAIYHGETETGVTVIHMTAGVDAGPAIAQSRTPIAAEETAAELEPRLAELGAPLVLEAIAAISSGAARPIEQDPAHASRAPRLKKENGAVDWSRPAVAIANQVRALEPWPRTYTFWLRSDQPALRLILERVRVVEGVDGEPGVVVEAGGDKLVIASGGGGLAIEVIQPAGKRALATAEFLRGYPVRPGDKFSAA
jgi:methionyl-tRNA formyltransferase